MRNGILGEPKIGLTLSFQLLVFCCALSAPVVYGQSTRGLSSLINSLSPGLGDNSQEERATVLHAGKAVRLTMPAEWRVKEVAVGRKVRLLISPEKIEAAAVDLADGIWLELDYHPDGLTQESSEQLEQHCESSLRGVFGASKYLANARKLTISGHSAAGLEFRTEIAESAAGNATTSKESSVGFHCVVQTSWCRLLIHLIAPSTGDQRIVEYERILEQLELVKPKANDRSLTLTVRAAASILGSWKANASRLRLFADGTVVMAPDQPFLFTTKDSDQPRKGSAVSGRFRAQDDLLFIEWEDESKLNYRWRLRGNQLLLTDHQGRIAQLARVSE